MQVERNIQMKREQLDTALEWQPDPASGAAPASAVIDLSLAGKGN
jgi:hypothetical protein